MTVSSRAPAPITSSPHGTPTARACSRSAGDATASTSWWSTPVFVQADAAPTLSLADTLGPLPDIVARGGLDVDALAFHHRSPYTLEANWKVAVENYLECYHCAVAHPGFSDVIDVDEGAYRLESHPTFASHYARVREHPRGSHYDATGLDGQFHLVWPALKINVMPGRANLSSGPLTPVSPARTEGVLDYFFAADEDPAWIADYVALDDQVGAEDRVLVESVQRGMSAGVFAHGELLLPSEDLIAAFQRWVADGLQNSSRGNASVQEREPIRLSDS